MKREHGRIDIGLSFACRNEWKFSGRKTKIVRRTIRRNSNYVRLNSTTDVGFPTVFRGAEIRRPWRFRCAERRAHQERAIVPPPL